jgi:cell division protein FtsA
MEEIVEHVYYEIRSSGFEKKLIAGIVLTGGGAQLKHIAQLTEFITGMDTRIGYPNEHLSNEVENEVASPMFSTGIGLVIEGISRFNRDSNKEMQDKGEKRKQKMRGRKDKKGQKPNGFLRSIQDWFERDAMD